MINVDNNSIVYSLSFTGDSMVKIWIGHDMFLCLIDTGSQLNILPSKLIRLINADYITRIKNPEKIVITSACGTKTDVVASYNLKFNIDNRECECIFHEVGPVNKMILGTPFLTNYKVILDFANKEISMDNAFDVQCTFRQIDILELPPGKCLLARGDISQHGIPDIQQLDGMILEVPTTKIADGLLVQGAVVTVCDGMLPILICNVGIETIDLTEHTIRVTTEHMEDKFCIMNIESVTQTPIDNTRQQATDKNEEAVCDAQKVEKHDNKCVSDNNNDFNVTGRRYFGPDNTLHFSDMSDVAKPKTNPYRTISDEEIQKSIGDRMPADMIDFSQTVIGGPVLNECKNIFNNYRNVFIMSSLDFGYNEDYKLTIKLKPGEDTPIAQRPYRLSPDQVEAAREHLDKLQRLGIIIDYFSEYNSPAFFVKKKYNKSHAHLPEYKDKENFKTRLVIDYRGINSKVMFNSLYTHTIIETLDNLSMAITKIRKESNLILYSSYDLPSAYHQIAVDEDSMKYLAFRLGDFLDNSKTFTCSAMGFKFSGSLLYLVMRRYLGNMYGKNLIFYADDILLMSPIKSKSHGYYQICDDMDSFLRAMARSGLKLHPSKTIHAALQVDFLGHRVSSDGFQISPRHMRAITEFPPPKNRQELLRFTGLVNYFNKHLKDRGKLLAPLNKLMKKSEPYIWGDKQQEAFEQIIAILSSNTVLAFPDFNIPFYLQTDASVTGMGAVLLQYPPEKLMRVIGYFGTATTPAQAKYPITCLELMAAVRSIMHFKYYLQDRHFYLITDHSALKQILTQSTTSPLLRRLSLAIQSYQFTIIHNPGKEMAIPDALSRAKYSLEYSFEFEEALEGGVLLPTWQEKCDMAEEFLNTNAEPKTPMEQHIFDRLHLPVTDREIRVVTRSQLRAAGLPLEDGLIDGRKRREHKEKHTRNEATNNSRHAPTQELKTKVNGKTKQQIIHEFDKLKEKLEVD